MLSGTRERAPVTPNARQQLARETNVALLCTLQPRIKVIESRRAECIHARGTGGMCAGKKGTARRTDRGKCPGSFAPFHFLAF